MPHMQMTAATMDMLGMRIRILRIVALLGPTACGTIESSSSITFKGDERSSQAEVGNDKHLITRRQL
jgi:hypothetical protein